MTSFSQVHTGSRAVKRVRTWYALLVLVIGMYGVRLFYVQIIRYDYYKHAALQDQLKQKEVPASRGIIEAHDGEQIIPIVLNQKLYTIFADPVDIQTYKTDTTKAAAVAAQILGGKAADYQKTMTAKGTRYAILAKKVTAEQRSKLMNYKFAGLYSEQQDYRTYPQGALASQLLGFVNNEGSGEYGIEQALNKQLQGKPGELKAITDLNGVPLAANKNNIQTQPVNGSNVVLTLDLGMQQQLETMLAAGVQKDKAPTGSALILDPHTGAIKAMANYPSYDPAHYEDVGDATVFNNAAVSQPIEIGSIMKTLTTAAALDQGVIQPGSTYSDPSFWNLDGYKITNIEEDGGPGVRSIADILNLSLNTGATWELMQMGGGQINQKARDTWFDYMANRFRFGQETGVEQGYEATGYVPRSEDNGAGIDLTYANTAFGQAMTATPLQVASALSSVLNGGTYYQPHLIDSTVAANGKTTPVKPKVLGNRVVSPKVGQDMVPLMQYVVDNHNIVPRFDQSKYIVGGKTGTAQIAKKTGGYYEDRFNGTYVGFVGGDIVQYVIVVFVEDPKVAGYAGSQAAQPIFANVAHMLINNSYVTPKS